MTVPDRVEKLLAQSVVTGIDFIYVHTVQTILDVYFYRDPSTLTDPLSNNLGEIKIYSRSGVAHPIPATNLGLTNVNGIVVLRVLASQPGTFAMYHLFIDDDRIDPYFNDVAFSFKANCPSDLDCKPGDHECPEEEHVDFPLDYSARDFWSYRRALMEFASLRYPAWRDRLAADAAVMLAEVMSAQGDEMAYYQDRIGREAYLETATQRRSMRRHGQLVDYNIHDGLGAFAWIQVTVSPSGGGPPNSGNIESGTNIWAESDDGTRIDFEIGETLKKNTLYFVSENRNRFDAYRWDEDQRCLPVGATEMHVEGHQKQHLKNFDGQDPDEGNGKWVLLKTNPTNPAQPSRAFMVRVIYVEELSDPVFNKPVTLIRWDERQALPFELDMTILTVHANMVPSTSGKTHIQYFITGADLDDLSSAERSQLVLDSDSENAPIFRAIEREGNDGSITFLCSLFRSEDNNLVWLGSAAERSFPEIILQEMEFDGTHWGEKKRWEWRGSFIGVNSSGSLDAHYTLDDGTWRRVVGYWREGTEIVHEDYASGAGSTIRFGNGEFGIMPEEKSVFRAAYRLGSGRKTNVASGTITEFDGLGFDSALSNPLNAMGGLDPESDTHIRQSAPEAFRTITYRAIREEDYAEAAERLPWVQKAGASFRWTGSWLSLFATADPKNSVIIKEEWQRELLDQLNRFRQAGREVYTLNPKYADIDLEIEVCASSEVYPGELKKSVMLMLLGKKGVNATAGFFSPDRFTFGDFLERSQLEAAIQDVPGVKAVEYIRFRRRGFFDWRQFAEYAYDPGKDSIIRVENDPLYPERGTVKIHVHGGA